MSWRSLVRKGILGSALVLLALPAGASASNVSISGSALRVVDLVDVAQNQTVGFDAATASYEISDGGGPMVGVAPCIANLAGNAVECPSAGITRILVVGGGGVDDIVIQPTVSSVIRTRLSGGGGPDVLQGGVGTDELEGGKGADTFRGGVGADTASYAAHAGVPGVRVTIGGGPISGNGTDGPPGARDVIASSVENVTGTGRTDYLWGDASKNTLDGAGRKDKLFGGAGPDTLLGRDGGDTLSGENGNDRIVGGAGRDRLLGQNGRDRLRAADGTADATINCGPPAAVEFFSVDALDPAPIDC